MVVLHYKLRRCMLFLFTYFNKNFIESVYEMFKAN